MTRAGGLYFTSPEIDQFLVRSIKKGKAALSDGLPVRATASSIAERGGMPQRFVSYYYP